MGNLLLEDVQYKIERTDWGVWKHYLSPAGRAYHEFTSHGRLAGMPMLHYTAGINPETGRRKAARGVIAVGKIAIGVFALGHMAIGVVGVGQLSFGLLFALGQASFGFVAVGQLAGGLLFGLGQLATGYVAIGQLVCGVWGLGQVGFAAHLWSAKAAAPEAQEFFRALPIVGEFLSKG